MIQIAIRFFCGVVGACGDGGKELKKKLFPPYFLTPFNAGRLPPGGSEISKNGLLLEIAKLGPPFI